MKQQAKNVNRTRQKKVKASCTGPRCTGPSPGRRSIWRRWLLPHLSNPVKKNYIELYEIPNFSLAAFHLQRCRTYVVRSSADNRSPVNKHKFTVIGTPSANSKQRRSVGGPCDRFLLSLTFLTNNNGERLLPTADNT